MSQKNTNNKRVQAPAPVRPNTTPTSPIIRTTSAPAQEKNIKPLVKAPAFIPHRSGAGDGPGAPKGSQVFPHGVAQYQQAQQPQPPTNYASYKPVQPAQPGGGASHQFYGVPRPNNQYSSPSGGPQRGYPTYGYNSQYGTAQYNRTQPGPNKGSPAPSSGPPQAEAKTTPKRATNRLQFIDPKTGKPLVLGIKKKPAAEVPKEDAKKSPPKESQPLLVISPDAGAPPQKAPAVAAIKPSPVLTVNVESKEANKEAPTSATKKESPTPATKKEEPVVEEPKKSESVVPKKEEAPKQDNEERKPKTEPEPAKDSTKVSTTVEEKKAEEKKEEETVSPKNDDKEEDWEQADESKLESEIAKRGKPTIAAFCPACGYKFASPEEEKCATCSAHRVPLQAISYDDESWNPEQPGDGKKKYTKNFLLQFREMFKQKPDDLNEGEVTGEGRSGGGGGRGNNDYNSSRGGGSRHNRSSPNRGGYGGRGGSKFDGNYRDNARGNNRHDRRNRRNNRNGGGSRPPYRGPKVVLETSENGWKPTKLDQKTEEGKRKAMLLEAQGALNKMTQKTFEKLSAKVIEVALFEDEETLRGLIDKTFDQALQQPYFCPMYAALCKRVALKTAVFRRHLLNKCQEEFEADSKEPPEGLSEEERQGFIFKARKRMLGNIKFIGELFKQKMLAEMIIHQCVQRLMRQDSEEVDEEQLEALCELLTNVGRLLDSSPNMKGKMDGYFRALSDMKKAPDLGARHRFKIEDLEDLRRRNWTAAKSPASNTRSRSGRKGGPKSKVRGNSRGRDSHTPTNRGGKKKDAWTEVRKGGAPKQIAKRDQDRKGSRTRSPKAGKGKKTPSDKGSKPEKAPKEPELSDAERKKYIDATRISIEEFLETEELEDVQYAMEQDFKDPRSLQLFAEESIRFSTKRSSDNERAAIAELLFDSLADKNIKVPALRKAIKTVMSDLGDYVIDFPLAAARVGPCFAVAVLKKVISFADVVKAVRGFADVGRGFGCAGDAIGSTLQYMLDDDVPPSEIVQLIKDAGLKEDLTDVLSKDTRSEPAAFYAKYELEPLFSGGEQPAEGDAAMDSELHAKLRVAFAKGRDDVSQVLTDELPGGEVRDATKVTALLHAFLEHVAETEPAVRVADKLETAALHAEAKQWASYSPSLVLFLGDVVELQVATIEAIRSFKYQHDLPKGFIQRALQYLAAHHVVATAAFEAVYPKLAEDPVVAKSIEPFYHSIRKNTKK